MKTLLIISHAPSTNTRQLQQALVEGAENEAVTELRCRVQTPFETTASQLRSADGLLFFTPENFGYMSGALKDLFDRTYYQLLDTTAGKPYALAIRAGSDGTGTRRSVEAILTGLAWKAALPAEIFCGSFDSHFTERAREYAQTFAVGLECGIF